MTKAVFFTVVFCAFANGLLIGKLIANAMDTDQTRSRECSPLNSTVCDRQAGMHRCSSPSGWCSNAPKPAPNPCGGRR